MAKRLRINGTLLRGRSYEEKVEATGAFERDVMPLLARGAIRVPIDKALRLEQAAEAHARIASNENFGKVVLECR